VDALDANISGDGSIREATMIGAFLHLADTSVAGYDVVDFLRYLTGCCVDLIDIDEASVILASPSGQLQVVAASTERLEDLATFELQNGDGPCLDAFRTGQTVSTADLDAETARWPTFAGRAAAFGLRAAHAMPMVLRDDTVGAVGLFSVKAGRLTDSDAELVRALADMATIGMLHERAMNETTTAAADLQHALSSRITIEQAKGVLAERFKVSIDDAFDLLRRFARRNQQGLTEVAEGVVRDGLDIAP
jgi:hypothetical protein